MPVSRLPVSLKSLARLLRSSEISSHTLAVTSVNAASASLHGCFSEIHQEIALRAASAADKRFANGTSLGWLDGIPFAIKDNFCTEFGSTTARCIFEDGIYSFTLSSAFLQLPCSVRFQTMFQRYRSSTTSRLWRYPHWKNSNG